MKKGFTLVELLVAAVIIGGLAVFATVAYRNSAAEARWTAAKARAEQLAAAVERLQIDYPGVKGFKESTINDISDPTLTCPLYTGIQSPLGGGTGGTVYPSALITCGYIENGGWTNDYWQYMVKFRRAVTYSGGSCGGASACVMALENAKLPKKYLQMRYDVSNGEGSISEIRTNTGPQIVLW